MELETHFPPVRRLGPALNALASTAAGGIGPFHAGDWAVLVGSQRQSARSHPRQCVRLETQMRADLPDDLQFTAKLPAMGDGNWPGLPVHCRGRLRPFGLPNSE